MKKLREFIQAKIDKYVLKRFESLMPAKLITSLYKRVVKSDLVIETKVVNVKKGKLKYTVVYLKTKDLESKFVVSRNTGEVSFS